CPDKVIEETYYFRWWTYRKHIHATPEGYVITEFLPTVPWAGKYNTINCAAGFHLEEGRWLHDPRDLDDYTRFWFRPDAGHRRQYSTWTAEAILRRALVSGDEALPRELLTALVANYRAWEESNRQASGLFWQDDNLDGMEMSISGSGYRPTLNSYLAADA